MEICMFAWCSRVFCRNHVCIKRFPVTESSERFLFYVLILISYSNFLQIVTFVLGRQFLSTVCVMIMQIKDECKSNKLFFVILLMAPQKLSIFYSSFCLQLHIANLSKLMFICVLKVLSIKSLLCLTWMFSIFAYECFRFLLIEELPFKIVRKVTS